MNTAFAFQFILFITALGASAGDSNLVQLAEQLGASTLVSYAKAAGLGGALTSNGPFTVFAPTNAAFDALPADVKDVLSKPSNVDLLRKVLEFHVIDGRKYSNQLSDNLLIPSLVQGLGIRVNIYNKTVTVDGAQVISADQNTTNGVIHVIDKVMYPLPTGKIPLTLAGMKFAAASAQLVGDLSADGPLTLFAPTNAAFDNLPVGMFSDLLSNQTALIDPLADASPVENAVEQLKDFLGGYNRTWSDLGLVPGFSIICYEEHLLKFHVLLGSYYSRGLTSGQKTALNGKNLTVTVISDSSVTINNAKVLTADISCKNGVLHVIDTVLIPPS